VRDIVFFEHPRRVFIIWASDQHLRRFIAKLKRAEHHPGPPAPFGNPVHGEAAYFVECQSMTTELAAAIIEEFQAEALA
jgi:hypothetical protein